MRPLSLLTTKRALLLFVVLILLGTVVPTVTVAAPPRDGTMVYYVQYGDTLFSIARRFGTTVPALMTANGLVSDYIYVGQRLYVPAGNPPVPSTPVGSNTCKYIVVARDTLFSIAYRYQTTAYALMQANYLYSPYIFVGQQLNVPCLNPAPSAFPTYTVQAGDNLFRLAIKYSTTIYAIAVVNGIPNPNLIYVGQTLIMPYPGSYVWPTGIPTVTPTGSVTPTATITETAPSPTTNSSGTPCTGTCWVVIRPPNYEPSTLTVTVGTQVTWLNLDASPHSVVSGAPGAPSSVFTSPNLSTNQSYSFTFSAGGTFTYYDPVQGANMVGTIIVQ